MCPGIELKDQFLDVLDNIIILVTQRSQLARINLMKVDSGLIFVSAPHSETLPTKRKRNNNNNGNSNNNDSNGSKVTGCVPEIDLFRIPVLFFRRMLHF